MTKTGIIFNVKAKIISVLYVVNNQVYMALTSLQYSFQPDGLLHSLVTVNNVTNLNIFSIPPFFYFHVSPHADS
jgi:hypothetical protein